MSKNCRYQLSEAVSGSLGGKNSVVDEFWPSQEQEFHPTTSLDENCAVFETQTDHNCYVDLKQTYLALKLKFVKGCGYESHNTKGV